MTRSAPSALQTLTGTGFTSPPSTRRSSPLRAGVKIPGTAMLALIASTRPPSSMTTSSPVIRLVATARKGRGRSANSTSPTISDTSEASLFPSIRPERGKVISTKYLAICIQSSSSTVSVSLSSFPAAYIPPTSAPMLVPAMTSGTRPASSSFWMTPRCAMPRAAPAPSASPSFGRLDMFSEAASEFFTEIPPFCSKMELRLSLYCNSLQSEER